MGHKGPKAKWVTSVAVTLDIWKLKTLLCYFYFGFSLKKCWITQVENTGFLWGKILQIPAGASLTRQSNTNISRELKLTSSESFLPQVLTDAVITQSLKLMNCTKVPLYFRLFLSTPFSLSSTDPKKNTKTSHSKKEEREQQPQHVLYPQQNMLVGSKIIILCQNREFSNWCVSVAQIYHRKTQLP